MKKEDFDTFVSHFTDVEEVVLESQNEAYYGMYIRSKGITYRVRKAKQTPKKEGQFVVLWEKDENNQNQAYAAHTFPDYLVVFCEHPNGGGYFIFPQAVLQFEKILRTEHHRGKMGFRLYPPWDEPKSKTAMKTQKWQCPYFKYNEIK